MNIPVYIGQKVTGQKVTGQKVTNFNFKYRTKSQLLVTEISGHTKFTSCCSDFVLKTLERASDLKMLIYFPFFVCLSFLMSET
jgi:hypothetical protein